MAYGRAELTSDIMRQKGWALNRYIEVVVNMFCCVYCYYCHVFLTSLCCTYWLFIYDNLYSLEW